MSQEILKRVEEIEARAAKATPGPWKWIRYEEDPYWHRELQGASRHVIEVGPALGVWPEDADFIARSREDTPWLCKVVRHLFAQFAATLERLRKLESAARLALQALTEGMADVPAERDERCAGLRVEAKRALREALGLVPRNEGREERVS